ncbi:antitoxin component HigA of HigAB toxin-antitoxin module [Pseudomonas frederiksbergensis]|uniref:hypothetical protein n=1 Tax=Pseudomonas frederiksbergensis TaxID=104087 RepID=UPI003D22D8F5
MNTKPIRTVDDLNTALLRIEQLWEAASNSTEGNELEVLAMLVEKYEDEHFRFRLPIPLKLSNSASHPVGVWTVYPAGLRSL